jgi:hypothetical protein
MKYAAMAINEIAPMILPDKKEEMKSIRRALCDYKCPRSYPKDESICSQFPCVFEKRTENRLLSMVTVVDGL